MQIENEFHVAAPPDRVYAFLLDVNRVVACMPGAELSEVVDPTTFKGKVRIKVGPITVSYNGTARIAERDEASRSAVLEAEGRETTGPGSARATARTSVEEADGGSRVRLVTDYTVAGRIANFGRGVMEDVSKRLVAQMADCIKANLEAPEAAEAGAAPAPPGEAAQAAPGTPVVPGTPDTGPAAGGADTGPAARDEPAPAAGARQAEAPARPPQAARPVNALSLFFAVLWDRIRRLFGRR
jgi:carbon monoxide dehydrogenase subunit G